MTTFDALGLPIFEVSDKIAATGDGLREDLNLIGSQARTAILAEGARAEGAARWDQGQLALNADLGALFTPGRWRADTSTIAQSIVDRPVGTVQPFTVEVVKLGTGSGVYQQTVTEWSAGGPIINRRVSLSNTYPAWQPEPYWDKGVLANGASLDTLTTPGIYRADTSTIARSIVGRPDGTIQPFTVEVTKAATASGVYLQTLTEWNIGGPIVSQRMSLSGVYAPWQRADRGEASRYRVTAFGDSLTAGGDINGAWPAGASWPSKLATYLPGVTVTNQGRSGDTTDEILIRAGALPVWFTVAGGTVPASGSVSITTQQVPAIRDARSFSGTLAGVAGTVSYNAGAWTFTRTSSGTAVTDATGKLPFTSVTNGFGSDTLIYWAGRNDIPTYKGLERTTADHVVAGVRQFLEWSRPQVKHVVIAGVTTGSTEAAGSTNHAMITEINDRLRTIYPGRFIDVQRYLVNQAITDMGLTPTAADTAAKSAGEIPPQLYAPGDTIHFSQATAAALAQYLFAPYLLGKGWV